MNKVLLVGRLVRDPEGSTTPSGIKYVRFTIAVNRTYGGADNQADFIPIVAWRNTADFVSSYMQKGSLVSVDGRFSSSQYVDKNNQKVTRYEVTADSVQGLEPRGTQDATRSRSQIREPQGNKGVEFDEPTLPKKDDENTNVPWEIMDL